jgi:opacity protein-like surface antigen
MDDFMPRALHSGAQHVVIRGWPKVCAGLAAAAAVTVAWPSSAAAETVIGVDLNFNDSIAGDDSDTGAGVDVYFGPRLDLTILTLTTELTGGFHDFNGPLDPTAYRVMAGGRLGVGVIIRPSIFAHGGVGYLRFDDPIGGERDGRTAFAGDLGLALDFTILPLVDLGIQGSYNVIGGNDRYDAFDWLQAGVHITFVLGSDS